ncbi:DUF2271 domain-containing protein [Clostridium sp. DJ247]|uniref:DUF2271 domain-containing protein n=1 Tax=Clostridium sp. DJ247 TaxID=2726188 RepID=UPI0016248656|nr:DUF2271 domain-containing protein [Clostridium sp. DJ247]MBC2581093.1 DUF2271 domain-containing protein [Clostridium sp. DJ247]
MKKMKFKSVVLFIGMLVFLSGCTIKKTNNLSYNADLPNNNFKTRETSTYSKNSSEQGLGSVKIQYNLSHIPKLASNQVAVWIEDTEGNYVRSLYASKFTASGGYAQRSEALSEWIKKSNWRNATKSQVDAVSSATQKPGTINITWDCKDDKAKAVKPGKYVYIVEGNIYWDNRVLWKGEVEVGNNENKSTAKAEYVHENVKDKEILIDNVSAIFTPKSN